MPAVDPSRQRLLAHNDEHGVTESCADQQDRENARPSIAHLVSHSEGDSRNHHTRLNFRVPLGQKNKSADHARKHATVTKSNIDGIVLLQME